MYFLSLVKAFKFPLSPNLFHGNPWQRSAVFLETPLESSHFEEYREKNFLGCELAERWLYRRYDSLKIEARSIEIF